MPFPQKRARSPRPWEGCDVFLGLSVKDAVDQPMIKSMAKRPIIFACANPDPENLARRHPSRAQRRHHRHRPLGLSQPGQQSSRLPLYLPRRARRARDDHQRGNEDRRRRSAGRPCAPGSAGRSRRGVPRRAPEIWARLHHSRSVRPTPHQPHSARGREGGNRFRCRAQADHRFLPLPGKRSPHASTRPRTSFR